MTLVEYILGRLAAMERKQERMMSQIDDLQAAQARLIDVNKRLIAKVAELQGDHVDPAVVQAMTDAANAAVAEADAAVPPAA